MQIALAVSVRGHLAIWEYKMVDRGLVGQRPLCRGQINSKIATMLQTKAGERLIEVTVKAVLNVSRWFTRTRQ